MGVIQQYEYEPFLSEYHRHNTKFKFATLHCSYLQELQVFQRTSCSVCFVRSNGYNPMEETYTLFPKFMQ